MFNFLYNYSYITNAIIAGMFTFILTGLGASLVFLFKNISEKLMKMMLAISGGIMIAASFYSLLLPAEELATSLNMKGYIVCTLGFISGGILIYLGNYLFSKKNQSKKNDLLLIFSITLHNLPEGMAIGVAFGSLLYAPSYQAFITAWMLAIGIGIQNFPEGSAISFPLLNSGMSKFKSFMCGLLSAIVEPIGALLGVLLVTKIQIIMPFLLSLAAGCMIYIAVTELIPESQKHEKKGLMTLSTIIGFALMMFLDTAL